jgi:hypothetical protein
LCRCLHRAWVLTVMLEQWHEGEQTDLEDK